MGFYTNFCRDHLYVLATTHGVEHAAKLFLLFFAAHFDEWFTQNRWYKTINIGTKALEIAKVKTKISSFFDLFI